MIHADGKETFPRRIDQKISPVFTAIDPEKTSAGQSPTQQQKSEEQGDPGYSAKMIHHGRYPSSCVTPNSPRSS